MTERRVLIPCVLVLVTFLTGCDRRDPLAPSPSLAIVSTPVSLTASPVATNQIDLAWQDNATNETGFEVHRSTTGAGGTFTLWAVTGAGVTSYGDVGLNPSTQYCYTVRAFRTTGRKTSYSAFSVTACATTPAPPPPPPPAAPSEVNAWPSGSTAVGVGWRDNSTTEDGFRIERSLDAGASWTIAGTNGPPDAFNDFYDIGRTSEHPVCYRVIAFNASGDSPPSSTDCTTPPAGPTDLAYDQGTGQLTWMDNSAVEDGYEVWACSLADYACSWQKFEGLPPNSESDVVGGCDTAYYLVATKDGGYSDASTSVNTPACQAATSTSVRTRPSSRPT
jgi:hypothetical protein